MARRYHRIVVKLGTSVLTRGTKRLDRSRMIEIVRQCVELVERGCEVIICSSGAMAAGRERLGHDDPAASVAVKQMLAAVGQSRLIQTWEQLFDIYGIPVGQVLLTRADVHARGRFLNARDTLRTLIEHGIVPIINENDAVATSEIRVGDNDNLSALTAILTDADLLLLMTDQAGVYTADPRSDSTATLIPVVERVDRSMLRRAGESVSGLGVGGMRTKLQAAHTAQRAGIDVVVASGGLTDVILRAVGGEDVGTYFPAHGSALEQRKRWILAGRASTGRISVDEGAARALTQKGSSLLPAGIRSVEGSFQRGDRVLVYGPEDDEIAHGLVRYGRDELERIMGHRSELIEELLGYTYGPAAIHRNDLILMQEAAT